MRTGEIANMDVGVGVWPGNSNENGVRHNEPLLNEVSSF
jgi:hypothetical protein